MLYPKHKRGHLSTALCAELTAVRDCSEPPGDVPTIYCVSSELTGRNTSDLDEIIHIKLSNHKTKFYTVSKP